LSTQSNLATTSVIHVFENAEFESAFKSIDVDGAGKIAVGEVARLLEKVYKGPAPALEVNKFAEAFAGGDGTVALETFLAALALFKAEAEAAYRNARFTTSSASEFTSGEEYRHHIRRHTRMRDGPTDKWASPVTAAQDVGFCAHEANLKPPGNPKKSCAETVYAAELIKSGVFY
jgi:hypothetical protein